MQYKLSLRHTHTRLTAILHQESRLEIHFEGWFEAGIKIWRGYDSQCRNTNEQVFVVFALQTFVLIAQKPAHDLLGVYK